MLKKLLDKSFISYIINMHTLDRGSNFYIVKKVDESSKIEYECYKKNQEIEYMCKYFWDLHSSNSCISFHIENKKASISLEDDKNSARTIRSYDAIKNVPEIVLNKIKDQIKIVAQNKQYVVDLRNIPPELLPQQEQEAPKITGVQGTGETPGGEGGR